LIGAPPKGGALFFYRMPRPSANARKQRVRRLLRKIEKHLDVKEMKATLADFIRLTQLERELEQEEQPKEIIVTWIDPAEGRSGSK
jgi:hypothetical protein